jgi:hypothetical protein
MTLHFSSSSLAAFAASVIRSSPLGGEPCSAFLALFAEFFARLAMQALRVGLGRTFLGLGFLGHIVGGRSRGFRSGGRRRSSRRGHLRETGLPKGKNKRTGEHQASKSFHGIPSLGVCFVVPGAFTLSQGFLKGGNTDAVTLPRVGIENNFTYKYICILLEQMIFAGNSCPIP